MAKFMFDRVENIAGKGENAGFQYFLLSIPQRFQKFTFSVIKSWDCGEKG